MPPPQPPYPDIEALVLATHRESGSIAFRIVRNHADAEDAMQSAYVNVMLRWQIRASRSTWTNWCERGRISGRR